MSNIKKDCRDIFLEMEKKALHELSDDEIIYEDSQTGPQEEPCVKEFHIDIKKWNNYKRKKEK